ncbi:Predicted membrane protein [Palleronia salina]|uniref:Predicted membrane protein n=1 Tax=Palleronia salina TaxID=313368 RepID=A0A1M6FQK3_9RHOB|nr:DUF2306 domain-containing protein [Palleronia salina]SHI99971.1 Predicted membrane protein [Palleronia salina]
MRWARGVGAALLWLALLPFALYAVRFGLDGLRAPLPDHYLFHPETFANAPMSAHMILGAALTLMAPLQIVTARRANGLHRRTGPVVVAMTAITAVAGLTFIALRGTIGGPNMSAGFTLYGGLMLLAALATARFAARDRARHRRWALRLVVLAVASWIFRVHYGIWYAATGGWGSNEALTGPFDRIQVWAFFLPYLALLEWKFARERRATRAARP